MSEITEQTGIRLHSAERSKSDLSDGLFWLWTFGQAGIVALYAGRIRLTSGYPEPVEMTTDIGLACGQLILDALLGPDLFKRRTRPVAVAAIFALLSARLAERNLVDSLRLAIVTALWIAALAGLTRSSAGFFAALFLTICGPLLFYARLEYGTPIRLGSWATCISPTLGVCTTRFHGDILRPTMVPVLIIIYGLATRIRDKTTLR